jgi:ABC-2 type transport system permease protein
VYIAVATAFGLNLSHVNVPTALVFLVLTVAAISPIGILAAALAMVIKKTGPVEWISNSSAQLFGGVYLPLASLPAGLQIVGWLLPITHALNGFRGAASGLSLSATLGDAIWLVVEAILMMPISLWLFGAAVRRARVDGTLAMY